MCSRFGDSAHLPALLFSTSGIDVSEKESSQIIATSLQQIIEENVGETTRVAIWLKDYDTPEAIATESMPDYETRLNTLAELERHSTAPNETARSIEMKRRALNICYEPYTADFATDFLTQNEIIYCSTYLPMIIAELTNKRIEQIATLNIVESIDYYNIEAEDIKESTYSNDEYYYTVDSNITYIRAKTLRNSMSANSTINVGILDAGIPDTTNSVFRGLNINVHYSTADVDDHASQVLEIFSALAPYANFYCTSFYNANTTTTPTLADEIEWFLDNDVSVLNISLRLYTYDGGDLDGTNTYGAVAQYLDKITYLYDMIIVISAGNSGSQGITSGGMAYNVITVGNFDRGNNAIASTSSYYAKASLAEKPDISAPGYYTFSSTGASEYGTSFSAPTVAGVVALLVAQYPILQSQAPYLKALLAASTRSSHRYTLADDEYTYYGAGVIDAENARIAANSGNIYSSSASPTEGSYEDFYITLNSDDVARVAMAFEKINTASTNYLLADLDLRVYNTSTGEQISYSVSTQNNMEIIQFMPPYEGTYKIRVNTCSLHSSGSSTIIPFYFIAWSQGGT